jgi:O-antigen ligase
LSILWSVHRPVVMPGWRGLAGTTGYGIVFSFYYNLEEQLRFLTGFILAIVVISLFLILFFPAWGIMPAADMGAWRGLFEHKNYLGFYAALGVVLFAQGVGGATRHQMLSWTGLAACVALSIGSRCLTGIFAALAALIAYGAVRICRKPRAGHKWRHLTMAWIAAAVIVTGLIFNLPDRPLSLVGREINLSQRMHIWSPLLERGAEHRWLGYGLNSFWNRSSVAYDEVMQALGWFPEHSHNGMIDIYLELGLTGVAIFVVCLARVSLRAFRDAIRSPSILESWHIVFLVFMATYNLAESQLFDPGSLNWFLFVTATCNLFGKQTIARGV